MRIFDKFKKIKKVPEMLFIENTFSEFFAKQKLLSPEEDKLLVDKYAEQLNKVKEKFQEYKNMSEMIIDNVSDQIVRTVITKGAIANVTPFYEERLGCKLNGKYIDEPIMSDYCMKYHYDSSDRIIMVEEYSVFLERFMVTEIYLYHDNYAEKLWFSSGLLARLFVLDNAFSNTNLSLSFSDRYGKCIVEEFIYEDSILKQVNIGRACENGKDTFIYEKDKLIMIAQICSDGSKRIKYTAKKPNYKKIQRDVYDRLKNIVCKQNGEFKAFGIEGFLDQQPPGICVCFTVNENPSDLIADWNVEMNNIDVYDWRLNEEQEKKCVKMIAEIIVSLANEGLLTDKQIYFHQNQVCVSQLYSGVKGVFRKVNLNVK